jgi:multidrug efflux pump subunit AcrA (membrane-fusion protein)
MSHPPHKPCGSLAESLELEQQPHLLSPPRVQTRWQLKILAFLSVFGLVTGLASLVWLPWQQSVVGSGRVIVLSPMQRPQNLEAPIKARLSCWYVQEGQVVKAGELVADLAELDIKYLDTRQTERLHAQRKAVQDQLEAGEAKIEALKRQISSLETYRVAAIEAAGQKIRQSAFKLTQEEEGNKAAKQNLDTAKLNFKRLTELQKKGIRSRRDLELGQLSLVKARTSLAKAGAAIEVARQAQRVASLEQKKTASELDAKLWATRAYLGEAREKVAKTKSLIQKLDSQLANLRARVAQRRILAPIAGRVVRLLKVGAGETVKQGDVLAVLVPDTADRAVELFLSGNDAPLVSPGRHVRLQFAGWPALQFAGWPSVAIGTFGGKVTVVDAVDDGKGRFRVLVVPETSPSLTHRDEPWPDASYLRPGGKVSGWVMLDVVSLGFELWRQFNGFAPTLKSPPGKGKGSKK